jgi:predicted DNA-binding transcriptional regulator YafY
MARAANQKVKLFYLLRLFKERTDDEHYVTMADIIEYLESNGIPAERKAIYGDLDLLGELGYEVVGEKVKGGYHYHLISREFEVIELKLLIDAVQSSRSITEEKSRELIGKLESFTSKYDAVRIHKRVIVKNRVKAINEKVYYTMDTVDEAINQNKKISFEYLQWDTEKKLVPKKNGIKENISPWAFIWDNECYYLLAYDPTAAKFKHYRVDKMASVTINPVGCRDGSTEFNKIDLAIYAKECFSMFGGDVCTVKLECKNALANVIIDKFGTDVILVPKDDKSFTVNVKVAPSKMFYGWLFGLGEDVKVVSPKNVCKEMRDRLRDMTRAYE